MAVCQEEPPDVYLDTCYKRQNAQKPITDFAVLNVHKFFVQKHSTLQDEPMKVLDYGCGPVLADSICAAGVNAEIVMAENGEGCCNALQDWLDRSP